MALATQLSKLSYINGVDDFGLQFPSIKYSATLAVTTDTTLTVPSSAAVGTAQDTPNKWLAIFHYDEKTAANVWVALGGTAAVPAGATFATTTSILKPSARIVRAAEVIHFYSDTASINVSVEFFAIQEG